VAECLRDETDVKAAKNVTIYRQYTLKLNSANTAFQRITNTHRWHNNTST